MRRLRCEQAGRRWPWHFPGELVAVLRTTTRAMAGYGRNLVGGQVIRAGVAQATVSPVSGGRRPSWRRRAPRITDTEYYRLAEALFRRLPKPLGGQSVILMHAAPEQRHLAEAGLGIGQPLVRSPAEPPGGFGIVVVDPQAIAKQFGQRVLRRWVALQRGFAQPVGGDTGIFVDTEAIPVNRGQQALAFGMPLFGSDP